MAVANDREIAPFGGLLAIPLLFQAGVAAAGLKHTFWEAAGPPLLALVAAALRAIEATAAAVASPAWVSPLTMRKDRGTFAGGRRLQIWGFGA